MLDLTAVQPSTFGRPGGRKQLHPMSPQAAKLKADAMLAAGLPPGLKRSVDLLSVGGVMTAEQLGVSPRTLRKYAPTRVVDRLPYSPAAIVETFTQYGLPLAENHQSLWLFALGPVGIEIARMRHGINPPTGYAGYSLDRIVHDVVVNEIVLRISHIAMGNDWVPIWVSEQEAALYQGEQQILKPDALLRLRQSEQEVLFLIEYHNEDHGSRAADKVQKYERAYNSGLWQEAWKTDRFPSILVTFRKPIVARGYQEALDKRESGHCAFFSRHLHSALTDTGNWFSYTTGQREYIFPWPDGNVESEQVEDGTRNGAPAEK